MATKAETALRLLLAGQSILGALRDFGIERRRAIAIMERAEAEGREPTIEDLRAELSDLGETLDELERAIDAREGSAGGG